MRLLFAGDCRIGKNHEDLFSSDIKNIVDTCDINCVNFEGPIVKGEYALSDKRGPVVNQYLGAVDLLKKQGINCFNLANNHISDYGKCGIRDTLEELEGIYHLGAGLDFETAYRICRFERNKVSLISVAENGFGCCCENLKDSAGYAWMCHPHVIRSIIHESQQGYSVIVICHAGAEEFELPLPEIRELYRFFVDVGARAVIGHHPHVIQGIENYKGAPICYSLGNLAFDSITDPNLAYNPEGLIAVLSQIECGFKIDLYPTLYVNGKIELGELSVFEKWEKEQKDILNDREAYNKKINDYCVNAYKNVYRNYYLSVGGVYLQSLKSRVGTSLRNLLKIEKMDELMILHNIDIETHRWVVSRALRQSNEDKRYSNN